VPEPLGGAHRHPGTAIAATGAALSAAMISLGNLDRTEIRRHRRDKFLAIGRTLG
jgi:acetyl-CoA carboxylase carboxyl transferase subunit alpha